MNNPPEPAEEQKRPALIKRHGAITSRLTTYSRPSLEVLMTHCIELPVLEAFYAKITEGAKDASPKTLRRWKAAYEQQKKLLSEGAFAAEVQLAAERRHAQLAAHAEGQPVPAPDAPQELEAN